MLDATDVWGALDSIGHFLMTRPSESTPLAAIVLVPLAAVIYYAAAHARGIRRFRFARVVGSAPAGGVRAPS